MLQVQQYLRQYDLEALEAEFKITYRRHCEYPNLVLLKYDQIASPFEHELVKECRGLILDEANDWNVVCYTFRKFFNYGEPNCAEIDWNNCSVLEKKDGSLAQIYHFNGQWRMATSGSPDASGNVGDFGFTFKEHFWDVFKKVGGKLPTDPNYCFAMELTGPYNRVVIPYQEAGLTLLGARHLPTLTEVPYEQLSQFDLGVPVVGSFDLSSYESITKSFDTFKGIEGEGYVVVSKQLNGTSLDRAKIKHPGYVYLHRLKDGTSRKSFVEIVRSGESAEVITYFAEFKEIFDDIQSRYNNLLDTVKADYEKIKHIEIQKEFALEAVKTRCSAALFSVRSGRSKSFEAFFQQMPIDHVMQLLGLK